MSDVVKLVPRAERRPSSEAIEMLKEVIAKVESGEFTDVAISAISSNGTIHSVWFGFPERLIAPTEILKHRILTDLNRG